MNIFSENFKNKSLKQIITQVNDEGVCFIEKSVNLEFISKLIELVENKRFHINNNWISGVYYNNQYYLNHLLAVSRDTYELITNKKITELFDNFFDKSYRLKALRYYETGRSHKMSWHTDNKNIYGSKKTNGLIIIIYLSEVADGEFQYIKYSHKHTTDKEFNEYSNEYINKNYNDKILSFKGSPGDLIIYNVNGIHRAKPVLTKNFLRKSLFFQIDENFETAEPILINPSFISNREQKNLDFLGFGMINTSKIYPQTDVENLPLKHLLNLTLIKNIIKKCIFNTYTIMPKSFKNIVKMGLKKKAKDK